jgi:hypothetical protein
MNYSEENTEKFLAITEDMKYGFISAYLKKIIKFSEKEYIYKYNDFQALEEAIDAIFNIIHCIIPSFDKQSTYKIEKISSYRTDITVNLHLIGSIKTNVVHIEIVNKKIINSISDMYYKFAENNGRVPKYIIIGDDSLKELKNDFIFIPLNPEQIYQIENASRFMNMEIIVIKNKSGFVLSQSKNVSDFFDNISEYYVECPYEKSINIEIL